MSSVWRKQDVWFEGTLNSLEVGLYGQMLVIIVDLLYFHRGAELPKSHVDVFGVWKYENQIEL